MSRAAIAARYGTVDRLLAGAPDQPVAPGLPAGTVTDDTEQALLLARLLIEGAGHVEAPAFAGALDRWEADMVRRGSADLLSPSRSRWSRRWATTRSAPSRSPRASVGTATPSAASTASTSRPSSTAC